MDSYTEINKQLDQDESEEVYAPKARRSPDPINKYDYCLIFARLINKPVGYVLAKSKGFPLDWLISIHSELKSIRDPLSKVKYVSWFLRESRAR